MRVIVIQDGAMIADVMSSREAIYVGSKESCRIRLSSASIASQQLVIYPESSGEWSLEQLAPEFPVRVNGAHVHGKCQLKTGDEITIGECLLRVFPDFEEQAGDRRMLTTSRSSLERFAQTQLPAGTFVKKLDEPITVMPGSLIRMGQANIRVSQCSLAQELMDVVLSALLETFAAQRVWIGVRRVNYGPMEFVEGRLLAGGSTDLPEIGENLKPRVIDRAQFIQIPALSREDRTSVLAGPLIGPDGPLGMVYLDNGGVGRRFEITDLDLFMVVTSIFAAQLDAIFKQIARTRAAMIDGQVSVAHDVQAHLTPRRLPQWDTLQFGAFREPGREHTGDVYDVLKLINNLAAFMVSHTRATGSWPSMLMAQAHSCFRNSCMHQDTPQLYLRSLNWIVYDGEPEHELSCFAGAINPDTGEMRYSIAGQIRAYIIGNRGEERRLGVDPPPALGVDKNAAYPLLSEKLEPQETVVVFTPGVTTARNSKEESFGEERFVNILCDGFGQLASAMLKEMLTDLRNFTEGGKQPDDITVLLAHRV